MKMPEERNLSFHESLAAELMDAAYSSIPRDTTQTEDVSNDLEATLKATEKYSSPVIKKMIYRFFK